MATKWEDNPMVKIRSFAILFLALSVLFFVAASMSIVYIGGDEVGVVEKKFGTRELPAGRILAVTGEKGIQAQTLPPGWHFFKWPWVYKIKKEKITEIPQGSVGLIQASDGLPLLENTVYAPEWPEDKVQKMFDAEYFLTEGKGYKGPQLSVLKPGKYRLNTKLFSITQVPITNVKVGTVGVIKSNVGPRVDTESRLVEEGQRGIWNRPLGEGQYYLHSSAYEITHINIRQIKVDYTSANESRGSSGGQRPITVRSKDGFTFPVDVRITYIIERKNAPLVVATVGDDDLVLANLVTPAVRATFRNNGEKIKALDYVQNRSVQEEQSFNMLTTELEKYGVTVLAVRIGDVGDEESLGALLKTQTDREIALQEQATFEEQQRAAEKEKDLTKTRQQAEEEKRLATAEYSVQIAQQDKEKLIIQAQAQAEQVKLVAQAKADAYKLVSEVLGTDNAALLEVMKLVAEDNIRITPDVMVGAGGSATEDALMGTILRDMLNKQKSPVSQ